MAENSTNIDMVSGPGYVARANSVDRILAQTGIHQGAAGAAPMCDSPGPLPRRNRGLHIHVRSDT